MSDEEIKIKCAEVMGWKRKQVRIDDEWSIEDGNLKWVWAKHYPEDPELEAFAFNNCPNYTQSLDAAMELVEWMKVKNYGFQLRRTGSVWMAEFYEAKAFIAHDYSPALAICKAFLAATTPHGCTTTKAM